MLMLGSSTTHWSLFLNLIRSSCKEREEEKFCILLKVLFIAMLNEASKQL